MTARSDELRIVAPQRRWTQYALYGWRRPDGSAGPPRFETAYSLREAIEALIESENLADELVASDAVLDLSLHDSLRPGPTIHVQLISLERRQRPGPPAG